MLQQIVIYNSVSWSLLACQSCVSLWPYRRSNQAPTECPSSGKVGTSISGGDQRDGTLVGEDGRGGSLHNDRCNWPLQRCYLIWQLRKYIVLLYIYKHNLQNIFKHSSNV